MTTGGVPTSRAAPAETRKEAPARGDDARREARRETAARDVALAAAAGRLVDGEARAAQAVAHRARGAPRRHRRTGRRQPRHCLEQPRVPHRAGCATARNRRERTHRPAATSWGSHCIDSAEREQQLDLPPVEDDPVQVASQRRPALAELGGERRQVGLALDRCEGRSRRRRRLDGDEVELTAALRILRAMRPRSRGSCCRGRTRSPGR